ncbi:exo-beta-N-acetylmuramidase NamZ family protein [Anaerocolumna sp. MB42-C2]|uniref:exo-beta-N-acetylmuramidase NamZ family protein n=1 Tax=Anaerocolumna sp. MB42-C2 TaxID=3070997 RepID=UPI0027E0C107|nr:DUF1343 domain-containing protein [Anaerocolumna sp. MB42-C2]WMJ86950.1 DUF1343 domain-containing protein [Anaerocolumna sp. MB42-C2]
MSNKKQLTSQVTTGIDNTEVWIKVLNGKRVGLVTNPTGVNQNMRSTIDILKENSNLVRLYSPEHGVRGDRQAGEKVEEYIDDKSGVPVYSLYGKNKKPPKEYLEDVDILAFDIQDVGSRLYTYISTMSYCMQSCAKYGKTFLVFDRPNPIGGETVEGNLIKEGFASFVGLHPIPYRYGLTIGELALLFQNEFEINCDLVVIPMKGWERKMFYEDTGLIWVSPSPNMPTVDTAFVYNGTCLFEGTNISEGRGTTKPFELVGAPWLPADGLAELMNEKNLTGVIFRGVYFTPAFSKHEGVLCKGVQLHITNRQSFCPVKTGIYLLEAVMELSGKEFAFTKSYTEKGKPMIDYNTGSDYIRRHKINPELVYQEWCREAEEFAYRKKKYHLY